MHGRVSLTPLLHSSLALPSSSPAQTFSPLTPTLPPVPDYPGAMFPWESAYTGLGVQPGGGIYDSLEQHITADVGLAVRLFYETHVRSAPDATKAFLSEMWPLLNGTCIFWDARLQEEHWGGAAPNYTVKGVVGPDESSGPKVYGGRQCRRRAAPHGTALTAALPMSTTRMTTATPTLPPLPCWAFAWRRRRCWACPPRQTGPPRPPAPTCRVRVVKAPAALPLLSILFSLSPSSSLF